MAIPTFDKFYRQVLALAVDRPVSRKIVYEEIAKSYDFTPDDLSLRLKSGELVLENRASWAMTFLTKAKLIERVAHRTYKATEEGARFLKLHPQRIRTSDLETIPAFQKWTSKEVTQETALSPQHQEVTATPSELMARQVEVINNDLRDRLLQTIMEQTPAFFEELVLDVLVGMGYGGSREDAAKHLGQSGDEGIDGRINQDALGLDQVMVQAKRHDPKSKIGRKEIQAFIGSLSGQGVTKGVFITTSQLANTVEEFIARGSTTKVVVVDGSMLIDLMLRYKIGVRVKQNIELLEIDQNYFDETEA